MRKISETKSWKELNNHLASLTTSQKSKEAGDIFEHICEYYLQTASQYQSRLKNVWLWKENFTQKIEEILSEQKSELNNMQEKLNEKDKNLENSKNLNTTLFLFFSSK